jgi:hemerythrin-like domain-containing protein
METAMLAEQRRHFMSAGIAGMGLLLVGRPAEAAKPGAQPASANDGGPSSKEADVNATEDLMREHGVLRRVLLVYRESVRRISAAAPPPADVLASAAGLIKYFIEAYHERLEEEEVFPRMEKAGKLVELVQVLRTQHQAGRKLTATIVASTTPTVLKSKAQSAPLVSAIEQFIRMYEPHAAREDTVLFPAFHSLFTEKEFDELGDRFEEKEHLLLGNAGFEGSVEQVYQLEKVLGIADLAKFTPT